MSASTSRRVRADSPAASRTHGPACQQANLAGLMVRRQADGRHDVVHAARGNGRVVCERKGRVLLDHLRRLGLRDATSANSPVRNRFGGARRASPAASSWRHRFGRLAVGTKEVRLSLSVEPEDGRTAERFRTQQNPRELRFVVAPHGATFDQLGPVVEPCRVQGILAPIGRGGRLRVVEHHAGRGAHFADSAGRLAASFGNSSANWLSATPVR